MHLIVKVVIIIMGVKSMKEYNLAENLYMLRTEKGKTQKEIADYLGIKQAAYSKYEVGETEPKITTLVKMARYFETDLNSLVGFSPLSPYEKAVKHIKYIDPNSYIEKKDNGEIRCIISREDEYLKLKKTEVKFASEIEFISCVNIADKSAIDDLAEDYKNHFVWNFVNLMTLRRLKNMNNSIPNDNSESWNRLKSDFEKSVKKRFTVSTNKRKTRSDKKDGEK